MREFSDADVRALVDLRALTQAVDLALTDLGTGTAWQAPKQVLGAAGDRGMFLSMAAVVPRLGLAIAKWASYVAHGPARRGGSTSTIVASHAATGEVLALVTGMAATTARTAAATAAVARRCCPQTRVVTLIGYGKVNQEVAAALVLLLPRIEELRVVTRDEGSAGDSGPATAEISTAGLGATTRLRRFASAAEALPGTDLAVSATGSRVPVAQLSMLDAGAVVIALDGAEAWDGSSTAAMLSDHDDPQLPSLARAFAQPRLFAGVELIDLGGSAVTDAALCHLLLAEPA